MTYKNLISLLIVLMLTGSACQDSYNEVSPDDADYANHDNPYAPTELDTWLTGNFTVPYNIEVKYRWDNGELDPYKNLVPPAVGKVQGVMEVVKKVWIDTYTEIAGINFIREYCPKQFVLVGSANYNYDGSTTIGTAEGGRKVVLFVVNNFDPAENAEVKQLIHTVQHEFAHILHQTLSYPSEFKEITPGSYTANWSSVPLAEARARGFITSYAMASPDEDFVEMVAMMLVEGKRGYEQILACETNATSKAILRRKEQLVVEYFRESFHIDFYALQNQVTEAIEELAPSPPLEERLPVFDVWGFGKAYSSVKFDFNFYSYPSGFTSRFASDFNTLRQHGYGLDTYFRLVFTSENEAKLQLHYHTNGDGEREYYVANYIFEVEHQENGVKLWYIDHDENGRMLNQDFGAYAILDYFAGYMYRIDWDSGSCPSNNFIGFYPVTTPNAGFTYGVAGN